MLCILFTFQTCSSKWQIDLQKYLCLQYLCSLNGFQLSIRKRGPESEQSRYTKTVKYNLCRCFLRFFSMQNGCSSKMRLAMVALELFNFTFFSYMPTLWLQSSHFSHPDISADTLSGILCLDRFSIYRQILCVRIQRISPVLMIFKTIQNLFLLP